ncbi:MAG: cation transporter [Candidatus Brocadiae bacterium]|nr:cation transporter [Candidatus Brocadiia bacterium]
MREHEHGAEGGDAVLSPDLGHLHAEVRKPMTQEMRRLRWAMAITGSVMLVEVVGGVVSNSLALLSDAGHMFTHMLALGMSYFAMIIAARPATQERTFGYFRAEVLMAFVNGLGLLAIAGYICYTAVRRTMAPLEIRVGYMLAVAGLGLVANGGSVALLAGISARDLNLRAAFFHVLYDTVSSVAVVSAAVIIRFTGLYVLDPLVSLGIAALILFWSFNVIRESVHILLEGTPKHLDLARVRHDMEALSNVHHVHDVHVWQITTNMHVLTAHVVVEGARIEDTSRIISAINDLLRERYGIGHSTLQIEYGLAEEEHHGTSPREAEGEAAATAGSQETG